VFDLGSLDGREGAEGWILETYGGMSQGKNEFDGNDSLELGHCHGW